MNSTAFATEYPLLRASLREAEETDGVPAWPSSPDASALVDAKRSVAAFVAERGRVAWQTRLKARGVDVCDVSSPHGGAPAFRPISRAFYKLDEIFKSCVLSVPSASLHLGEAPGGFVQCTAAHARGFAWKWCAVSIDGGPAFATASLPLRCGRIVAADMRDVDKLVADVGQEEGYDLVTGDGATDMDHDEIEAAHAPLLWAQAAIAVRTLAPEGALVLKYFEGLSFDSAALFAQLSQRFQRTSIIKPRTSRATNSERYFVAVGFVAADRTLLPSGRVVVAEGWLLRYVELAHRLARDQVTSIKKMLS